MSVQAVQPTAERARSPGSRDGDRARVLRLLEDDQTGALTIAALRERGVEAPALIVYELQLAGYEIDRVPVRQPDDTCRWATGYDLLRHPSRAMKRGRRTMSPHPETKVGRGRLRDPLAVRVDRNGRGEWGREPVTCETLDDARRVAYLCAAHRRPCEPIVCDAYHRVLDHEFINGRAAEGRGEPDR